MAKTMRPSTWWRAALPGSGAADAEGEATVDRGVADGGDQQRHQVRGLRADPAVHQHEQHEVGGRRRHAYRTEPHHRAVTAKPAPPTARPDRKPPGKHSRRPVRTRRAFSRRCPATPPPGPTLAVGTPTAVPSHTARRALRHDRLHWPVGRPDPRHQSRARPDRQAHRRPEAASHRAARLRRRRPGPTAARSRWRARWSCAAT